MEPKLTSRKRLRAVGVFGKLRNWPWVLVAAVKFAFLLAIGVLVQFAIDLELLNAYQALILSYICITIISCLGLNIIYGFTGQFALSHAAFMGLGAYSAALITHYGGASPWMFVTAVLGGGALAGGVGYLVGLPILRLRSDYLGIATLGFGIIVKVLLENSDKVKLIQVTGGARGMTGMPQLTTFLWAYAILLLAIIVARNLRFSSPGRACLSIREDETAANLMGVNVVRYKTIAFVLGCFYAGVAGGLYAHAYPLLHPRTFDFLKSFDPLLIVVLGGLGSITGTLIAGAAWVAILEGLRMVLPAEILDWRYVIYPVLLVVMMLWRPQGLFGTNEAGILQPKEPEAPAGPVVVGGVEADGAHS